MSAPNSKGLQSTGVANVLSTISGMLFSCATLANRSISKTVSAGLAIVSPNISLVLGFTARRMVSSSASQSTKMHSMPYFFSVTENRLTEPPYTVPVLIKLSPALHRFRTESMTAAIPDEVHIAPTPPSRSAIFCSTASTVGLAKREYMGAVGISNSAAIWAEDSKRYVVL